MQSSVMVRGSRSEDVRIRAHMSVPFALLIGLSAAPADDALTAWVRHLEATVIERRELAPGPPFAVEIVVPAALEAAAREERPPELCARAAAYEAFGLADPGTIGAACDAWPIDAGGTFDAHGERILCRDAGPEPRRRIEAVHAVVGALLGRHHGHHVARGQEEPSLNDDVQRARRALREGEAHWISGRLLADEARAIASTLSEEDDPREAVASRRSARLARAGAPSFVREADALARTAGVEFVRVLFAAGGWPAVDAAVADPQLTTEHLLHPGRYLDAVTRDQPRAIELAPLVERWPEGMEPAELVVENSLGEFGVGEFIRMAGDPVRAVGVADGWDGDRYRLFAFESGATLLQWEARFDREEDAAEAIDALRKVLQRRFHEKIVGEPFDIVMDAEKISVTARDEVGRTHSIARREGDHVLWLDARGTPLDAAVLLGE